MTRGSRSNAAKPEPRLCTKSTWRISANILSLFDASGRLKRLMRGKVQRGKTSKSSLVTSARKKLQVPKKLQIPSCKDTLKRGHQSWDLELGTWSLILPAHDSLNN